MAQLPATFTGPGLVDLQINGCGGFDFNSDPAGWSAEQFGGVRGALAGRGITAALPTLITDAPDEMIARAKRYAQIVSTDAELAAALPALHIEGPFISPVDGPRGAHPKCHCKLPAGLVDLIDRLRDAADGRVAIVTVAPELPGAIDLIARWSGEGLVMAIGHTQASKAALAEAVAAGATLSTHLGNGSHQMLPRLDNYVQTQLADDGLHASFIADGHHMPFTTLKNFIRAKTPSRSILVSDAIAAAGMGPGEHVLGNLRVVVSPDGRVSHPGQANLAGAALTLDQAVVNVATHCDVSFARAWAMASTIPAQLANLATPPTVTVSVSENGFAAE